MTGWLLLALGAAVLVPTGAQRRLGSAQWRPRWPPKRSPARTPEAIVEMLSALRDELRAGSALRLAFETAVESVGDQLCPQALAVSRMGGSVPDALRNDARGEPLLLSLAALWQVCEGSGAALATALDRLVAGARQSARVRREVRAQLAGPRATMRVLAVLPVIGLGMGVLMGADPLGFLTGSIWGWGCLLVAGALELAGVLWMRRLVRGIERQI